MCRQCGRCVTWCLRGWGFVLSEYSGRRDAMQIEKRHSGILYGVECKIRKIVTMAVAKDRFAACRQNCSQCHSFFLR